jgi:hypothetical protein
MAFAVSARLAAMLGFVKRARPKPTFFNDDALQCAFGVFLFHIPYSLLSLRSYLLT